MHKCVTLILSAGYSTRMRGDDKLLEKIDGISQIYRIAKAAVKNGITYMTLPLTDHPRDRALSGLAVQKIFLNNKNIDLIFTDLNSKYWYRSFNCRRRKVHTGQ